MQAIITKYIGPTNTRGSRCKASAEAGSITVEWDDALNSEENHAAAARALVAKLGWVRVSKDMWFQGGLKDGYVFVCAGGEGIGGPSRSDYTYQVRM